MITFRWFDGLRGKGMSFAVSQRVGVAFLSEGQSGQRPARGGVVGGHQRPRASLDVLADARKSSTARLV
jgi:hypothetical protein